jgi:hypothetical protein
MFTVTRRLGGSKGKVMATTRSAVTTGFETTQKQLCALCIFAVNYS